MMKESINRRGAMGLAGAGIVAAFLASRPGSARPGRQFEFARSPAEWRRILGPERYAILREAGTERPYSSPLNKEHRKGTFACAGCGLPLFNSAAKFDSGTGWPSFFRPLPKAVVTRSDHSLLMERTEVLCRRCGGHPRPCVRRRAEADGAALLHERARPELPAGLSAAC